MMDDEAIENSLDDAKLVKDVLGMDVDAFDRYKKGVTKGLIKFGGSFAYHLGLTLQNAEHANAIKILSVWRRECMEHEMLYRIWKAKQEATAS